MALVRARGIVSYYHVLMLTEDTTLPNLRVTILGASGFIGRHLATYLRSRGDTVIAASLRDITGALSACDGSDVVVNLTGAPVAARWTPDYKEIIRRSRVDAPRTLIEQFGRLPVSRRPRAYIAASAIGYYGTSLTETFTETSGPGDTFLADVCSSGEHEAMGARDLGLRVAIVRTGIVLGGGGTLEALTPLFKLGLGGRIASGRQWCSWIHIDDQVGIYAAAIDGLDGVLNATAPNPVTNAEFSRALATVMHRPALLVTPAFALQLGFGEGATMMTEGQKVLPARTRELGYRFQHSSIAEAMRAAIVRGRLAVPRSSPGR